MKKITIFIDNNIPSRLAFGKWKTPQDEDSDKLTHDLTVGDLSKVA